MPMGNCCVDLSRPATADAPWSPGGGREMGTAMRLESKSCKKVVPVKLIP